MHTEAPCTLAAARVLRGHGGPAYSCAVSADGSVALSCGADATARVWDLRAGGGGALRGHVGAVWRCAIAEDGRVAGTAGDDGCARVWSVGSGGELFVLRWEGLALASGCALSGDGGMFVASFRSADDRMGRVVFCDWRNGRVVHEICRPCSVFLAAASRDAAKVAFVSSTSPVAPTVHVEVIDYVRRTARLISCSGDTDVAMTPSGSHFVVADRDSLRLFDGEGSAEPAVMQGYECGKYAFCALTESASHIVATAPGDSYCVWDTAAMAVVAVLRGHTGDASGCAVSADGSCIATCSADGTVRVWFGATATAESLTPVREPRLPVGTSPVDLPSSPPSRPKSPPLRPKAPPLRPKSPPLRPKSPPPRPTPPPLRRTSPPPISIAPSRKRKINSDNRYDLFISFCGTEELLPGICMRDVARETREQTLEKSGGLASVFFDEDCVRGCRAEQRFEAILQTRGGGTVLFLVTKDFFNTSWCLKELRTILRIHARGNETGNGEKFKLRFMCFSSSADEILGFGKPVEPQIEGYVIECIPLTTLEDMGSAIASVVDGVWREDPPTMFGDSALVSFMLLANMFRDDVAVASVLLQVSGEDIITVVRNAMQGPNLGLYNVELLKRIAALSTNKMAVREKVKSVNTYTAKWIDSRRWSWSIGADTGTEAVSPE